MSNYKSLKVSYKNNKHSVSFITNKFRELKKREVLVKVKYSGLNYKDALSVSGTSKIIRNDKNANPLHYISDSRIDNMQYYPRTVKATMYHPVEYQCDENPLITADGSIIDPWDVSNWNWIGYLPQISWDVDSAFGSLSLSHGDYLKTQISNSQYYGGWGWYPGAGEGFVLNPAVGLQLNVVESSTLVYPEGNALTMSYSDVYFETLDDLNRYKNSSNTLSKKLKENDNKLTKMSINYLLNKIL